MLHGIKRKKVNSEAIMNSSHTSTEKQEDVEACDTKEAAPVSDDMKQKSITPNNNNNTSVRKKLRLLVGILFVLGGVACVLTLTDLDRDSAADDGVTSPSDTTTSSLDHFSDLTNQLAQEASGSAVLLSEISNNECRTIFGNNGDDVIPIGSTFQLYVLGALAKAVAMGNLSWLDEVVIRADLKSLPTGVLLDKPEGTTFTVFEMATLMIRFSDNTATDHLMNHVGQEAVEDMLTTMGHSSPALNLPFLTTADVLRLKVGLDDTEIANYLALDDPEERRAFLENLKAMLPIGTVYETKNWIAKSIHYMDSIGWFGSPNDICRAYATLGKFMDTDSQVKAILSIDAPLSELPYGNWDYVGYKGDFEPGLVILAYLAYRKDGRQFVQVLSLSDDSVDYRGILWRVADEGLRLLSVIS